MFCKQAAARGFVPQTTAWQWRGSNGNVRLSHLLSSFLFGLGYSLAEYKDYIYSRSSRSKLSTMSTCPQIFIITFHHIMMNKDVFIKRLTLR